MGAFFNTAFALITIPLIYFNFGPDSNHDEFCINRMENLEKILDEILSSQNSPTRIHENTKNLYDACLQTVGCFDQANKLAQNSTIREWSEFFRRIVKPVCDSLRYQSGEFFKCISEFQVGEFKLNSTKSDGDDSFDNCYLGDAEYGELSEFVERNCGFSALKNMMEYENHVRSTLCKSIEN